MTKSSASTRRYKAFGLHFDSSVPLFDESPSSRPADVSIQFGVVPEKLRKPHLKGVLYEAAPGEFLLRVDRIASYYVSNGNSILVEPSPEASQEDIRLFLMGSAIGALLHQRGVLPLHGSSIEVDGQGVVFVGESGVGKSTIAGGFQRLGFPVLSDDICAVRSRKGHSPEIIPGLPCLKLWADTLQKLGTGTEGLDRVRLSPDPLKFFLPFSVATTRSVTIRTIFVLESTNENRFIVDEHQGADKLQPIVDHTYRLHFLDGLGGKSRHFKNCSEVARSCRVIRVRRPGRGFLLNELIEVLTRNW